MVAAMSHELRTQLTRLRLRAEFIEDQEQQRLMLADLDSMGDMIDPTLAFVRDDAQRGRTCWSISEPWSKVSAKMKPCRRHHQFLAAARHRYPGAAERNLAGRRRSLRQVWWDGTRGPSIESLDASLSLF
jgi:signal transduction histidine kinase